jgi:hypothetical protein
VTEGWGLDVSALLMGADASSIPRSRPGHSLATVVAVIDAEDRAFINDAGSCEGVIPEQT